MMADIRIAGCVLDIALFLDEFELRCLQHVSRLLWIVLQPHLGSLDKRTRARRVISLPQQQAALVRELRSVLQRPTSSTINTTTKRTKGRSLRLRDGQLLPLLRDLSFVGLGVRASCLVDTCQLDKRVVRAITGAAPELKTWYDYGLHSLVAIIVAGNVFFVNPAEFVRLKCLDLMSYHWNLVLVDASGKLKTPQYISREIEEHREVRRQLTHAVQQLVHSIVDSVFSSSRNRAPIEIQESSVCPTAMAGLILCYPVVYHVGGVNSSGDDSFWTINENCLSMCPLHHFQTSLSIESVTDTVDVDAASFNFLEFSLPQNLRGIEVSPSRIAMQCKQTLERTLGDTDLVSIHVDVSARTLPRVAL